MTTLKEIDFKDITTNHLLSLDEQAQDVLSKENPSKYEVHQTYMIVKKARVNIEKT
jgi:deferrochelatase/peroxidase EfeB